MGSAGKLLEHSDCDKLNEILKGQRRGYTAILRDAANALALCGIRPIGLGASEKIKTCVLIRCAALKGCDSASLAEYMITCTTFLSLKGAKQKSSCFMADDKSKALMERLLRFEDANCRRLREFL